MFPGNNNRITAAIGEDTKQEIGETANTAIEELTAKLYSLTSAINTTQSKIDGINSTHTDVELGDDEYKGDTGADAIRAELDKLSPEEKAEIDAALERAMKEHPDWFTDDSSGTSPAPYQGPPVGTPSTGELPTYNFGESGHVEGGENMTPY